VKPSIGNAWLVGVIFFLVTNAQAVVAIFGSMSADALSHLTHGQIAILTFQVVALAGTNVLAYLNRTFAQATDKPPS
jgi:hypothetical protein